MNDAPTRDTPPDQVAAAPRSWLTAEVEGRTVGFWIVVALLIAVVTLGVGAWWVWGLDGGTPMGEVGDDMAGTQAMAGTEVRLPAVAGFYAGEEIFSAPGDDYSPRRRITLVTWRDEVQARELRSADNVTAASNAGELE